MLAIETQVSYQQTNFNDPNTFEDSIAPAPLPSAFVQGSTATTQYELSANVDVTDFTSLGANASMLISAISDDIDMNWMTIDGSASATADLTTTATVQGVSGNAVGSVEFQWTVGGQTKLSLQDNQNVTVSKLSALTVLRSTIPGSGGTLLTEFQEFPGGSGSFDLTVPTSTGGIIFPVPFEAGTELPVGFELLASVDLEATNDNFGGFRSELEAAFGTTATLDGVMILDQSGARIAGATLVADNGFVFPTLVPEPSGAVLALLPIMGFGLTRRRCRRMA